MRKLCTSMVLVLTVLALAGSVASAASNIQFGYPAFKYEKPRAPRQGASRQEYERYFKDMEEYKRAFERYRVNADGDLKAIQDERARAQKNFDRDWKDYDKIRKLPQAKPRGK